MRQKKLALNICLLEGRAKQLWKLISQESLSNNTFFSRLPFMLHGYLVSGMTQCEIG